MIWHHTFIDLEYMSHTAGTAACTLGHETTQLNSTLYPLHSELNLFIAGWGHRSADNQSWVSVQSDILWLMLKLLMRVLESYQLKDKT